MRHPFDFTPSSTRKPLFFSFLSLTLILFAVFRALDTPLRTASAPYGIVSFELAGNIKTAAEILASWDARAQLFAAFGLGLDYLFMPAYALALSFGILLAAGRHTGWFTRLGSWLGWHALAAALFDAAENFALWQTLVGNSDPVWPFLAFYCAVIKFTFLLVGLTYALFGWLWPRKT
ncbi:MAG: hypothetical protein HY867_15155 [Chloroflexi bacterium]|nr:hypothetical protein [Chloroflexota bacterium]